jgi:hypothetical protein
MTLTWQEELFITQIVDGVEIGEAFRAAINSSVKNAKAAGKNLLKKPWIKEDFERRIEDRARVRVEATKLAIEHSGITQARVAVELGRIGFANMADYADVIAAGSDLAAIIRDLPRDRAAALTEAWLDAQGGARFKLGDKRAALMDIAKLFGWIVEKRENKVVDEFDSMTNAELEAWLDERAEARMKLKAQRQGRPLRLRSITGGKDREGGGIGGGSDDPTAA